LIVGPASFRGLNEAIISIARAMPVLSTDNDIENVGITAKSSVTWEKWIVKRTST
jgi:protein TorT